MRDSEKAKKIFTRDFLLVFAAAGMMRVCYQMQNTLMPLYMEKLGYAATAVGLAATMCTVASLVLRPLLGGMLDRFGRRRIVLAGTGLFAAATLCCGLSGALAVLLLFRVMQGAGFAAHTTAVNTMATDILPEERMSEGIGYMGLTSSVSLAVAPGLALMLTGSGEYKGGFLAAALAGLLAVICLVLVHHPDQRAGETAQPALSLAERLWEKQAVKPALMMMVLSGCYAGISTFMAVYALGRGFTAADMSIYFTVNAVATAAARLFGGRAARRLGEQRIMLLSVSLCLVAFLIVPFSKAAVFLWIAAGLHGLGYGTIYPLLNAMAIVHAAPERRGTAMATFLTGMDIGAGFGAGLWGVIIDHTGMEMMFWLCAGICVAFYGAYRFLMMPKGAQD